MHTTNHNQSTPQHEGNHNYCVSYFTSLSDRTPVKIHIMQVFKMIEEGHVKDIVAKIQSATTKEERTLLKKGLSAITVSGVFAGGHAKGNLTAHSGAIQIDIDNVPDPMMLKEKISKDKFTFAVFLSPSGTGLKIIVKINPERHLESFKALKSYFKKLYEIDIDKSCKDVCRLMYLSYDPSIFVNEQSIAFELEEGTISRVAQAIDNVRDTELDITSTYEDWLNIGFALADYYGEAGRTYYHIVSSYHPEYDVEKCNIQYDNCLQSGDKGITIGTFLHILEKYFIYTRSATGKIDYKYSNSPQIVKVKQYINDKYDLRLNDVSGIIESKHKEDKEFTQLNENSLYIEIRSTNIKCSMADLLALLRSDFAIQYNPFQRYFEELEEWDGTVDCIDKVCDYLDLIGEKSEKERFRLHFKKMLVRTVACAIGKDFNKQCFVIIGRQNNGKTTFCRWLCPPALREYYAENINTDKDSHIALCENFIINLDELASFDRRDINAFKSMFSKEWVKARHPYGRKAIRQMRRGSFLATTNKEEFLNDETGSVRWLCFHVDSFNFKYSEDVDINQLWAQAYKLYKENFEYKLSSNETTDSEACNASYQVATVEQELIQRYYLVAKKGEDGAVPVTTTDILFHLKSMLGAGLAITPYGIGRAMTYLGFQKVSERIKDVKHPRKVYYVKQV